MRHSVQRQAWRSKRCSSLLEHLPRTLKSWSSSTSTENKLYPILFFTKVDETILKLIQNYNRLKIAKAIHKEWTYYPLKEDANSHAEGKRCQSLSNCSSTPVEYQQGEASCIKRRAQRQWCRISTVFLRRSYLPMCWYKLKSFWTNPQETTHCSQLSETD